jgi:hypothetical protein
VGLVRTRDVQNAFFCIEFLFLTPCSTISRSGLWNCVDQLFNAALAKTFAVVERAYRAGLRLGALGDAS